MKKVIAGVAGGIALLGGAITAPIIPTSATYTGVSYNCFYSQQPTGTTSPETRTTTPCLKPIDGGDETAVAEFKDASGNLIYHQIPVAQYHDMGLKDSPTLGAAANPKVITESLLDIITPEAHAAVAFDTNATPQFAGGVASLTIATTLGSTATLFVACSSDNGLGTVSYTYNAVAFTGTVTTQLTQTPNQFKLTCAYLVSPATGAAHNLVASRSVNSGDFYLHADSYSGTALTGIPDATTNAQTTGTSFTATVTTVACGTWSTMYMLEGNGGLAAGTGSTLRGTITNGAVGIFDSNTTKTPAGSMSMNLTGTSATQAAYIMFSFPQAASCTSAVPPMLQASIF